MDVQVLSGPPQLVKAAIDAVQADGATRRVKRFAGHDCKHQASSSIEGHGPALKDFPPSATPALKPAQRRASRIIRPAAKTDEFRAGGAAGYRGEGR